MIYRENSAKWVVILVILAFIIFIPAGVAVYVTELRREFFQIKTENNKLKDANDHLIADVQVTQSNYHICSDENSKVKQELELSSTKLNLLNSQIALLQDNNFTLNAQIRNLNLEITTRDLQPKLMQIPNSSPEDIKVIFLPILENIEILQGVILAILVVAIFPSCLWVWLNRLLATI